MNVQIDTAIKRARGYWFVDGFTEMAMGGLFIILAGFLLISMNISQAPFPSWFLSITGEITILKIASFLIVILILWWLKDHFTYPRTLHRFRLLGGMILLVGIGVGIWQLTMGLPNIPANIQPEVLQPPVLESINRALTSLGLILLISGVILMFSGILTFIRYRRENPQPYGEDV